MSIGAEREEILSAVTIKVDGFEISDTRRRAEADREPSVSLIVFTFFICVRDTGGADGAVYGQLSWIKPRRLTPGKIAIQLFSGYMLSSLSSAKSAIARSGRPSPVNSPMVN